MLLAWFNKSTTSDFTVQDLITEIKTWFTEGYLYDDVWEALREKVVNEVLPSAVDVKNMIRKRRKKRASSVLRKAVRHPITFVLLVTLFVIDISYCKFN